MLSSPKRDLYHLMIVKVEYKTSEYAAYIPRSVMGEDTRGFVYFVEKEFQFHTGLEMLALTTCNDGNK